MPQFADIVTRLRNMPPLPQVAQRVLAIVRDPEYSVDALVAVVRTDPALTARLLRLCNSALFRRTGEIRSIGDAVAYLGTRHLVKLVLVSCASTVFRSTASSAYTDANALWRHTFAVATAAQWLAWRGGLEQPDAAFTAGILHNVGKVVLSQMTPASGDLPDGCADLCTAERHWFGIDHAAAAGVVGDAWQLPRELRFALRHHHDPASWTDPSPLPALLATADDLVLGLGIANPLPFATPPPTAAAQHLHLEPSDLEAASSALQEDLQRHAELLNLDRFTDR
jgi:HD-like signal output (HDOD) protein